MTTFFQYGSFIAGGSEAPGTIGNLQDQPHLSFFRLVGATYFRAHASAFTYSSPVTLYHSIVETDPEMKHEKWLEIIRKAVWQRADSDTKNMPSTSSLRLHWTRCMWVLMMWSKSTENDIDMPGIVLTRDNTTQYVMQSWLFFYVGLETFGWTRESGYLQIVWDDEEHLIKAKERIV